MMPESRIATKKVSGLGASYVLAQSAPRAWTACRVSGSELVGLFVPQACDGCHLEDLGMQKELRMIFKAKGLNSTRRSGTTVDHLQISSTG